MTNYVLKSEYDAKIAALETENAALKETINNMSSSSQLKYPWQEFD